MANNMSIINNTSTSSSSNCYNGVVANRKVHVVYYLSRSGQLEHPHLLEVSIAPNEGLYLRDVKKRLAMIRGNKLASAFSWSYKRNYKNVTVWQDLCDDDLIFPANGCEYVLKGSEILTENSSSSRNSTSDGVLDKGPNSKDQLNNAGILMNPNSSSAPPKQPVIRIISDGSRAESLVSALMQEAANTLAECGTDAATQTDQDHATELNKMDLNSPPSVASMSNAPSPYHNNNNTNNIGISSSRSSYNQYAGSNPTATPDHESSSQCHIDNNSYNNRSNPANNVSSSSNEEKGVVVMNEKVMMNHVGQFGSKTTTTPGRNWAKEAEINSMNSQMDNMENEGSSPMTKAEAASSLGHVKPPLVDPASANGKGNNNVGHNNNNSKSKHSGALSLLQLMSCGSLDIKDQTLPMALYQFRSNGVNAPAERVMCGEDFVYGGSDGKLWSNGGGSLYHELQGGRDYSTGSAAGITNLLPSPIITPLQSGSMPLSSSSSSSLAMKSAGMQHKAPPSSVRFDGDGQPAADHLMAAVARASMSDRSANGSRELAEYSQNNPNTETGSVNVVPPLMQRNGYSKAAVSGEIGTYSGSNTKASSELVYKSVGTEPLNHSTGAAKPNLMKKAASGEIHSLSKFAAGGGSASPLFLKQILMNEQGAKSEHHHSNQAFTARNSQAGSSAHQKRASSMPSKAFSEGEISCMVQINGHNQSKSPNHSNGNGYDRSMAQLWEELLCTAPSSKQHHHHQNQNQQDHHSTFIQRRQAMSMEMERERTLQNAVGLSLLPPLEHLILQECPQRKVKVEMKSHMKICNSPKSNNKCNNNNISNQFHNSINFGGKNSSNLCKRFFRHPPNGNELK